jgi:hypothetical protein
MSSIDIKIVIIVNVIIALISYMAIAATLSYSQTRFGVIDEKLIVSIQAKEIARSYPNGQIPPEKLRHLAEGMKGKVQEWGNKRGLTLLTKSAVWSGKLPDYTDEILAEMGLQR